MDILAEVSYPEDVYIPEPVVPDEPTVVPPIPMPQIDRTRKPIPQAKPESPVIEEKELPVTVEERPSTPVVIPIPDRSVKPTPSIMSVVITHLCSSLSLSFLVPRR